MNIETKLISMFGKDWYEEMKDFLHTKPFLDIAKFVKTEREAYTIYPESDLVFRAFRETGYFQTKVVIFGLDPYHDGNADGLAFSGSKCSTSPPPPLKVILKEIERSCPEDILSIDFGRIDPWDLSRWADQGVLLLNTALTVREGIPKSHLSIWVPFILEVLRVLGNRHNIVYLLLGQSAQKLKGYIAPNSFIIEAPHPAAELQKPGIGFLGSDIFKKCNEHLEAINKTKINW
jgi:uracil-DNA glycosylase